VSISRGVEKMFEGKNILVYDIETSSVSTETAIMRWFGGYSYLHDEYYLIPYKGNENDIKEIIAGHKILVSFNGKAFDNPIIQNNLKEDNLFDYKVLVDLYEISAPKGSKNYGKYNKNKLIQMGYKLKNFTLKSIIELLKLDDKGTKGDINYEIFQQETWVDLEIIEIKKYLKQDIDLTKKLFEWYHEQFKPLIKFLPQKDQDNFLHLKTSLAVLSYNIICNKAGLKPEFGDEKSRQSFAGGHHVEPRWDLVKGQIYEIDFASAYPHAIMMGNLQSPVKEDEDGWGGDGYYKLEGKYNKKERGKIELAINEIYDERIKAKKEGDKPKDKSYKIVLNSYYGLSSSPLFKSVYNRVSASDCTSMVRTWIKKLAKILEENNFKCLYGFTDSIFVLVPPHLEKKHLMFLVDDFIKEAKEHVPFQLSSFKMGVEEEIKMIWFVAKNCYLFVTNKNEIKYKSTLLNTNTPKAVMKLFDEYMKPIIIEKLDIPFTKKELEDKIKSYLEKEPELAAQEYKVSELSEYKVESSLHYQISKKYGPGRHFLIPNKKNVGVGLSKSTKKKIGIRHCTMKEFNENNLKIDDINLTHLLSHVKSFYERNEPKEIKDMSFQTNLFFKN
jgi:DNA polymerase elongation subunit (family B)